jgi:hypothetical protein
LVFRRSLRYRYPRSKSARVKGIPRPEPKLIPNDFAEFGGYVSFGDPVGDVEEDIGVLPDTVELIWATVTTTGSEALLFR